MGSAGLKTRPKNSARLLQCQQVKICASHNDLAANDKDMDEFCFVRTGSDLA